MPIVDSAIIASIDVGSDGKIKILRTLLESAYHSGCGCVDVSKVASDQNVSLTDAISVAKGLAGDSLFYCSDDSKYCCLDSGQLDMFVSKMRSLRS